MRRETSQHLSYLLDHYFLFTLLLHFYLFVLRGDASCLLFLGRTRGGFGTLIITNDLSEGKSAMRSADATGEEYMEGTGETMVGRVKKRGNGKMDLIYVLVIVLVPCLESEVGLTWLPF